MFENAGAKIKVLAKVFFWLTVLGGGIPVAFFALDEEEPAVMLLIPLIMLAAWLGTIMMYAFGELCENVRIIAQIQSASNPQYGTNGGMTQPVNTMGQQANASPFYGNPNQMPR